MSSNQNTGGNAKAAGYAAAKAQGEAEQAKQTALIQQQQQQSRAGPQANPRSFDSAGNLLVNGKIVQFADQQAKESYLSSRGVSNTGQIINQALYDKADWSNLSSISQADKSQASTITPAVKPEDNHGYTSKVSSIISNNFAKDPSQTNWDLVKNREAIQTRSKFSYQFDQGGGVKTKASEAIGSKYSWNDLGKSKGVEFLSRDSTSEEKAKQSQASKALGVYGPQANKDYLTGGAKDPDYNSVVTLGKAQKVFGNKTSFGQNDISKDQLSRDSTDEKLSTLGSFAGRGNTRIDTLNGKPFNTDLVGSKNNSKDVFQSIKNNNPKQASVSATSSQPETKTQDFNTFFSNAQAKGATIDIFNAQGAKVGSVKADNKGRQTLETLGGIEGLYFREDLGPSGYSRDTNFIDTISTLGKQGTTINIVNSKNQVVGTISGPNAYYDYEKQFGKSKETLYAEPIFSTTREGKQTTDSLISTARSVGATSVDVFLSQKGKQPEKIESLPLTSKDVSSALDKYVGNPNISFGATPKPIETPKDTTLTPASVTALDLNYVNAKSSTGLYFDLSQQVGGFLSQYSKESKLPATAPNETTNVFGIKIANPSTTLYEAGQNLGAWVIGGVKSIPPLTAGIATSYYNYFTKGSTGGPATKVDSPKALANVLGASFLAPQTFMGEQASKNFEKTSGFIHSNIGVPLKEQGIVTPKTVQNPKTIGAFVGTTLGIVTMAAPLAKVIPVRVAGEAGTIAFPGIGRIKSAGPLAGSEEYIQGPKTITITGVTLGYGGGRTVMLYGKSSEGKSFILSKLKPEYNPETGKENLHLETYYSSAERGSPFPESTKLTLSKLGNEKAGQVFSQIKNEQGKPKFSESEFGLELKAKEANKYYNKIPNQKVSEENANKFFERTSIVPEDPAITLAVKEIASGLQSRSSSSKNSALALLSGDTKIASSYGIFARSPLQPAKGSPIVVGQLTEYNLKQGAGQIPQPKAESVKDIDIELTNEKQSESLLSILNAKVQRPQGYEFSKQGTNIYYGLKGEKGKEVFNLLGDKDVNPTDLSVSSGSGVFGKEYPTKTARLGNFKTKTIGYQARALTNSLSATHNLELMEKTKASTEPKVFAGIQGRLEKSEHIVTAFSPRLSKDLSRNVAVLEYGIKTTKGKAREAFTEYKNALLEKHPYVELENVSVKELSEELVISKAVSKSYKSNSFLPNNYSVIASQFASTSRATSPKSITSSQSSSFEESSKSSTSPKSSRSSKSVNSILSTKSVSSAFSSKSGKSATSPKSSKSVTSTYSVLSPNSPTSHNSPISPTSPRSGRSISSISGSPYSFPASPNSPLSFPNYPTSTTPKKVPVVLFGNLGIKRKHKSKEGPTALINLDVNNIFSSHLDILVPNNRRVEF